MISGKEVIEVLNKIADKIEENKMKLTELDAAIGDGDHGLNMSKGFRAVKEKIKDDDGKDIGNLLKNTGMALVSNVGGASGPLYGTAFLRASAVAKNKENMDISDFIEMLKAAIGGVQARGKAKLGDKTMLDALIPAYNAAYDAKNNGKNYKEILECAYKEALHGTLHTKEIAARKGRASYLGDRSIGHEDPGAASSTLIIGTIYDSLK